MTTLIWMLPVSVCLLVVHQHCVFNLKRRRRWDLVLTDLGSQRLSEGKQWLHCSTASLLCTLGHSPLRIFVSRLYIPPMWLQLKDLQQRFSLFLSPSVEHSFNIIRETNSYLGIRTSGKCDFRINLGENFVSNNRRIFTVLITFFPSSSCIPNSRTLSTPSVSP